MSLIRDPAAGFIVTTLTGSFTLLGFAGAVGGPWPPILVALGILLLVLSVIAMVLLILERWAGASAFVEGLPLPNRIVPFLRKDAIEVEYRPAPDHWVHIYIRNNRGTATFSAEIADVKGAERQQTVPWDAKWRGHKDRKREIITGREWPIDLAQAVPPAENPAGVQDALRHGEFRLFSDSAPEGWPVKPGPSEIIGPREGIDWLGRRRVYLEALTLKLEVSRGRGKPIAKQVTLGFNPPFAAELRGDNVLQVARITDPVRVEITDWPRTDGGGQDSPAPSPGGS